MDILLSNDDGVYAWGLKIAFQHLRRIAEVRVVSPLEEKSTTGHSLTIHKPIRLLRMENGFFGVNGSPADCVYIGIREVMGRMPDLVISGINRGANLGQDVYYSGTVSAAREACILGIPAIAVSVDVDHRMPKEDREIHFETAAKVLVRLLRRMRLSKVPRHTLLNVNVPDLPFDEIKGIQVTRQGFRYYSGAVLKRIDHRGKPYFWIGGQYKGFHNTAGTDCYAVAKRYVSITPVKLDCTDLAFMGSLERILE